MGLFGCCSTAAVDQRANNKANEMLDATASVDSEQDSSSSSSSSLSSCCSRRIVQDILDSSLHNVDWSTLLGSHLIRRNVGKVETNTALKPAQLVLLYAGTRHSRQMTHRLTVLGAGYDDSVAIVYCGQPLDHVLPASWYALEEGVDKTELWTKLGLAPPQNGPQLAMVDPLHVVLESMQHVPVEEGQGSVTLSLPMDMNQQSSLSNSKVDIFHDEDEDEEKESRDDEETVDRLLQGVLLEETSEPALEYSSSRIEI